MNINKIQRSAEDGKFFPWADFRLFTLTANGEVNVLYLWDQCNSGKWEKIIDNAAPAGSSGSSDMVLVDNEMILKNRTRSNHLENQKLINTK